MARKKTMKVVKSKKEKKLGVAEKKRRYDLPLSNSEGTDFLILLVALMTFLATAALTASFALNAMGQRWSSGLENKATIEIPAEAQSGTLRTAEKIKRLTNQAADLTSDFEGVESATIMDEAAIEELIAPWLGNGAALEGIPLPGLIAVEFSDGPEIDFTTLRNALKNIEPDIRLDMHEGWLGDILRFTGTLQLAAAIIVLLIGATTVIAIAGAIRARIAIHKADVELLHLMGATDHYICRQFLRHAVILTFKGSFVGLVIGALTLFVLNILAAKAGNTLIPDFTLSSLQMGVLACIPLIACIIGGYTARYTVLRSLSQMP
jgi:cell division transport system permease protein